MIQETERLKAWTRDCGKCQNCGRFHRYITSSQAEQNPHLATFEAHHIYFRSQYKGIDRNESWNLAILCSDNERDCHKFGKDAVHNGNTALDKKLKAMADERKPVSERAGGTDPDLLKDRKARRNKAKKDRESFKERNDGLSPYQKQYKAKMEAFKKKNGGLTPSQVAYRKQKAYRKKLEKNT